MKKFFISSTLYDMHAERDMIQNIVQPAVNQKLNEQGEYISFSDLRLEKTYPFPSVPWTHPVWPA